MPVGWLYAWLYGLCPHFVGISWFCWLCPYSHYYILFPSPYSEMQPWFGTGSVLFGPIKMGYMIWLIWSGDGIVLTAWFFLHAAGCLCHSRRCVSQRPWPQWWDVCATRLWHRRWRAILTHIEILLQWLWQNIGYHKPNGLVIWCRNPRNPCLWLGSNVVVHISNVFIVHACGKPNHTQWNFSLGCKIFLRPSILVITPILVR